MSEQKYVTNIFQFSSELEFFTIATIAGIISFKFINKIYEELYDPIITSIIPDDSCMQTYYIGNVPVRYGVIMREFIKWILLIMLLMLLYNYIETPYSNVQK